MEHNRTSGKMVVTIMPELVSIHAPARARTAGNPSWESLGLYSLGQTAGAPNSELDGLRAEVKEFRGRLDVLENRPVAIERTVTISEATPAWIRAMIVIASAILVPTLGWGASQLYSLNHSMGVMEQRFAGHESALAEHEESTRREFQQVRLEIQQLRGEMTAGFADLKAEIRGRSR